MSKINNTRKESVTIIYKDDRISLTGDTFKLEGSLPTSELTKIYMGSKGRTVVTLTVEIPEPETTQIVTVEDKKTISLNEFITDLANKGMSEDDIMNTKISI